MDTDSSGHFAYPRAIWLLLVWPSPPSGSPGWLGRTSRYVYSLFVQLYGIIYFMVLLPGFAGIMDGDYNDAYGNDHDRGVLGYELS